MSDSLRPGLVRCQALTPDQQSNLQAKLKFERDIAAAGLQLSKRGLAKFFGVAESTLRGWVNHDALDRFPPDSAFEKLARYCEHRALWREFGALA